MSGNSGIKVVFGTANINPGYGIGSVEAVQQAFDILEKGGCKVVDTARLYGDSEKILGEAGAGKRFTVDTKARGGFNPEGSTKTNVLDDFKASKDFLGTNVDVYYLHAPDAKTPLDETLSAVNEIYKSGFFKRFGLSNFKAEDVQKVYDHSKAKGYVLPTVYQGNYSAVARKQEELLFPTLRKLGIAFYAYSPLAGGFLTKTRQQIEEGAGRFSESALGGMYRNMYSRPRLLDALSEWRSIAEDEGITNADLAYRWVKYNSPLKPEHGDAIIIGASSLQQLQQTLDSINGGALSAKAVSRIDEIWKKIADEAPLDNYHQ
ncbi:hypothetical protein PRZ48_013342 [Zasmidium cellare]|uniref:NADP-dependent oxidoreductase domain-containing protein n=1 Tax=Zasmidium cellare TaxID=395010 RepID=A0ABR0E0R8_ZASCE|nr:hypothetical protein PRZ48_013342 [Zasmidium cellare]